MAESEKRIEIAEQEKSRVIELEEKQKREQTRKQDTRRGTPRREGMYLSTVSRGGSLGGISKIVFGC